MTNIELILKEENILKNIRLSEDGRLLIGKNYMTDYHISVILQRLKAKTNVDVTVDELIEAVKSYGIVKKEPDTEILEFFDIVDNDDDIKENDWKEFKKWRNEEATFYQGSYS